MFQIKSNILIDHEEKEKEKKPTKQTKKSEVVLDLDATKEKISKKKIFFSVAILSFGAGLYLNPDILKDTFASLEVSAPTEISKILSSDNDDKPSVDKFELNENNIPESILNRKNQLMMQEKMAEKNGTRNNSQDNPVLQNEVEKLSTELKENQNIEKTEDVKFPEVNVAKKETEQSISNTEKSNETVSNSINSQPNQENSVITTEDSSLQKELNSLMKNAELTIKTKKENIVIFINNIGHNIGDHVLNSKKFIINDIKVLCKNDELPKISFSISEKSNKNKILYEKELSFSDGKKILMSFDSLSVNDIRTKTEKIYLPGESIFKNFKLEDIVEKSNQELEMSFTCNKEKITITGKELLEIK